MHMYIIKIVQSASEINTAWTYDFLRNNFIINILDSSEDETLLILIICLLQEPNDQHLYWFQKRERILVKLCTKCSGHCMSKINTYKLSNKNGSKSLYMLGNKIIFRMVLQVTHSQRSLSIHIDWHTFLVFPLHLSQISSQNKPAVTLSFWCRPGRSESQLKVNNIHMPTIRGLRLIKQYKYWLDHAYLYLPGISQDSSPIPTRSLNCSRIWGQFYSLPTILNIRF